ncbi:MAG TPA: ECF-type sigma factor [Phycisphaerales bacterium]|nr:ECF-type sigma factor [Phycisphaerales bacterium]
MSSSEPSSASGPDVPPPVAPVQDATILMVAAANGDKAAADRLLPLVYAQLRSAAQLSLAGERPGHTLSATALVHEAYVKLSGPRQVPWDGRAHFYAAAAEAMRQILLDHAKGRLRLKRGGGGGGGEAARQQSVSDFADVAALSQQEPEAIVRFDELVRRLEVESPDGAAIVRLRFFAGLSVEQTAQVLGLSTSTVDRRWAFARAWLFQRLHEQA